MKRNKSLIIVGHGTHSKVVAEAAKLSGIFVKKIIDSRKKKDLIYLNKIKKDCNIIIAIGDNNLRKNIFDYFKKKSMSFTNVIHPKTIISKSVKIKKGTFIAAGVVITNNVSISENCIINTRALIDHGTSVGAHSHIAPGAKIAGGVTIGNLCFIGVGSTVRDKIKISDRSLLGAGAVAVNDLDGNSTYTGIPAKKQINFKNLKILFLGRDKCNFSKKIFLHFKKNKINVTFLKTNHKNKNLMFKKLNNLKKFNFDFLISFRNLLVVEEKFLNKIKVASVNFHPGPPDYRGIGCANFAIRNQEKKYGCTTHLMNKKIDNGKILDVRYFSLKKNIDINNLVKKTHIMAFQMFLDFFQEVFKNKLSIKSLVKRYQNVKWSKRFYNRNQLNKLYMVDHKINNTEFNILLRASNHSVFKPYLLKNGKKFFYSEQRKKKFGSYITLFNKKFYYIKEKNR